MKNSILIGMTLSVNRKDWHFSLARVKITHTSNISNCKENIFIFTLKILNLVTSCLLTTIPFDWFSFMFIKFINTLQPREIVLRDNLWKKNENFNLKRLKFHSLQSENLLKVWNFTRTIFTPRPKESLQGGLTFLFYFFFILLFRIKRVTVGLLVFEFFD